MAETVQLRHELPDGTWHVDWLLDLDPFGEGPLTTFRLSRRVDDLCAGETLSATRLADHRREYLTYEGPISDGRGEVRRIASGRIDAVQTLGDHWALLVRWMPVNEPTAAWQRLWVHRTGDAWTVRVMGLPSS